MQDQLGRVLHCLRQSNVIVMGELSKVPYKLTSDLNPIEYCREYLKKWTRKKHLDNLGNLHKGL